MMLIFSPILTRILRNEKKFENKIKDIIGNIVRKVCGLRLVKMNEGIQNAIRKTKTEMRISNDDTTGKLKLRS